MKQINLLPQSVRSRAIRQQTTPFLVLAVVVSVVALGSVRFVLAGEVNRLEERVSVERQQEQNDAARKSTESQELAVSADLQNRVTVLNTLVGTEIDWSKALALVGELVPQDTTLSVYTYAVKDGVYTLTLTGVAPSNRSFGVVSESLRASKKVKNVEVAGYSYNPTQGSVTFTITAEVPVDQIKTTEL